MKRKKLIIIDGKSVFYRGYYAMPNLSLSDGTPTGGVYGFAVLGLEVVKKMQPDYVIVAWDKAKTNIRSRLAIYPQYKAGRKPMPDDMRAQIPMVRELLDAFGWPLLECDDYEADDIMGTLAQEVHKKGIDTMLVTSDLDMLQLVNDHVTVAALRKGLTNVEYYDPEAFSERYKVSVEQFIDIKALKGDASDNIPGVRGVGEKTAVKLIEKYGSLDGVYKHIDEQKGALKTRLEQDKEMAYTSRELVVIQTDAPVSFDGPASAIDNVDPAKISDLFEKFRFKSLLNQIPKSWHQAEKKQAIKLDTSKVIQGVPEELSDEIIIHSDDENFWVSNDEESVHVFTHAEIEQIGETLKAVRIVGHDVKETLKRLLSIGIDIEQVSHDTRVGAFLVNSLTREQSLSSLIGGEIDEADPTVVIPAIRQLYQQQTDELKSLPKVKKLAEEIEWPIIPVLARMEHRGIYLDTDYLEKMSARLEDQISDIEQEIYGYADQEFNISSPSQLADILYNTLGLPTQFIKKTKTGYSTAASELDKLVELHPIIALIYKYREWTKLKSTYVDALPKLVDENSRLHTTYALDVAPTGRLSSHDPNLQNIPIRSELGKTIRTAFRPAKGNVFISADYSQFELRLAAAMAGETDMIEAFNKDLDVHAETAATLYGFSTDKLTKNQRSSAKAVNFGIMYGLGPHGLAQGTDMNIKEAKQFIEKYFEIRPNIKEYLEQVKKKAHDDGYVETLYGRRRPTPDVKSSNFMVREGAYRAAINMPMQGTAADIMKLAMIELDKKLPKAAVQLLQIHDSVLIECPENQAEKVAKQTKEVMEAVNTELPVKLKVDYSIGSDWGEV